MPIVIIDDRICPVCKQKPDVYSSYRFEEFVKNPKIRFARFNKASYHKTCLPKDPDGKVAMSLHDDYAKNTRPAGRICAIDGKAVPQKDRIFMEFVTDDANSFLYPMTFRNYRISSLENWPQKGKLVKALKKLKTDYPDMTSYADDIIAKIGDVPDEGGGGFMDRLKGFFGK